MKVKEIERTANIAWSPALQHPIYLAAGTAAQQLDATFSTTACVEIYQLNLTEPGLDMTLKGTIDSEFRFHRLIWGSQVDAEDNSCGILVGGTDNGNIFMYDAQKLINGDQDVLCQKDKHTGPVRALDFNPFQHNLLASGASNSEIFIWDLNNANSPMSPGGKSQPPDDVTSLSWNRQVQYILASTFASRCVVWDLRKNEPIIKVSDSVARIRCKMVAWHPEVATQMCLASEDDHTPYIQLWDLRYATSPLKVLENHQRGVLSIAWCPQDPDLLLSCAKDNRILCWNPNSNVQGGEVLYELPTTNQWSFDVSWCPRNPAVISTASFDGFISVYSLMGGQQQIQPSSKIAESFPGSDTLTQPPAPQADKRQVTIPLKKPPKWLRRPIRATFAFGGKLVTFEHSKQINPQQPAAKVVFISQVVTEQELISRSQQLENAVSSGQLVQFCNLKISKSHSTQEEQIWNFLKMNFEEEPRINFLSLLGYNSHKLSKKVAVFLGTYDPYLTNDGGVDAQELAHKMSLLTNGIAANANQQISSDQSSPNILISKTPSDGNGELHEGLTAFDNIATTFNEQLRSISPFKIPVNDADTNGLIAQALLTGNFEAAVELCLQDDRMADAILLSVAGGPELLAKTQKKYFQKSTCEISKLIAAVVSHDWNHIVSTCDLVSWKEALAVILTYAKVEEIASLCESLGSRLEMEGNAEHFTNATLCYICAGNVERLVECWIKMGKNSNSPTILQDLIEKVVVLRKAVELMQGQAPAISAGYLANLLAKYAGILASQGSLSIAMNYLTDSNETSLAILRDRLYRAHGHPLPGFQPPPCPFKKQEIGVTAHAQPVQQPVQKISHQRAYPSAIPSATNFNTYPGTTPVGTYPQPYDSAPQLSNPGIVPSAGCLHKGPISHRYPSYPQPVSQYPHDLHSQSNYMHNSYNQTQYTAESDYSFGSNITPTIPSYNQSISNSYQPTTYPPVSNHPPAGYPSETSASHPSSHLPSYQDIKSTIPWNDPPALRPSSKHHPKEFEPLQPITQPMYGMATSQAPPDPYHDQSYGKPPTHMYNPVAAPLPEPQQKKPPEPVKEVVKGPIPSEHQILGEIFDELKNRCQQMANNPQMKKKLDDVSRKLEILYDKLREDSLSPSVTLGLHQIVQAIQMGDYSSGVSIHTQMVAVGNFSEIGTFMPGLKSLLQTALHLGVYVH